LKKTYPQGGNIFNQMRHGGYLLYQLSPEFKIYIDGRTNILYPLEFAKRNADLYGPDQFTSISDEIRRYDIEFAIYPLRKAWFHLADKSNPMSAEYVSKEFILLSTRKNNFPLSSHVMFFPMCWQKANSQQLASELARANEILPGDSALLPVLKTLVEVYNGTNPDEVFSSINAGEAATDYQKRLLGYVALGLDSYPQAFEFFQSIEKTDSLDLLMRAYAALEMQNYRAAEEIIQVVVSPAWAEMTRKKLGNTEQAIAVTLLARLQQHQPLSSQLDEQSAQMKKTLQQSAPALTLPLANVIPNAGCEAIFSTLTVAKK